MHRYRCEGPRVLEGEAIGLGVLMKSPSVIVGVALAVGALPASAAQLVVEVLTALEQTWLPVLEDTARPPDVLLDAYRSASATLGRPVRVELADAVLFGTATDVTATGELVVVDDQRVERRLSVGDVVHLRPAQ